MNQKKVVWENQKPYVFLNKVKSRRRAKTMYAELQEQKAIEQEDQEDAEYMQRLLTKRNFNL